MGETVVGCGAAGQGEQPWGALNTYRAEVAPKETEHWAAGVKGAGSAQALSALQSDTCPSFWNVPRSWN